MQQAGGEILRGRLAAASRDPDEGHVVKSRPVCEGGVDLIALHGKSIRKAFCVGGQHDYS
jgi:hypothetical protein